MKANKKEDVISDVVTHEKGFVPPEAVQILMQKRHHIMQNIQNISNIILQTESRVNLTSMVIKELEDEGAEQDSSISRIIGDFVVPITDRAVVLLEMYELRDKLESEIEKHKKQVKTMQEQHDGYSDEIDLKMEDFKSDEEKRKDRLEKLKSKRRG